LGDTETEDSTKEVGGLAGFINVAARLGDSRGDEALALKTLETGIKRFPEAPAIERTKAYLYRAELAVRIDNIALAKSSLIDANAINLTEDEVSTIADELAHVTELVSKV
jgi:hypothetical protein